MNGWLLGPHIFATADLEVDNVPGFLRHFGPPKLVYTDLPYNAGIAANFRRMAGDPRAVDFALFLVAALDATRVCTGECFFEIGRPAVELFTSILRDAGAVIFGSYEITYNKGNGKAAVIHFGWSAEVRRTPPFNGLDSWDTPCFCIANGTDEGDVVTDLCTGLGLTARETVAQHRVFLGTELNRDRMARAVKSVARLMPSPRLVEEVDFGHG